MIKKLFILVLVILLSQHAFCQVDICSTTELVNYTSISNCMIYPTTGTVLNPDYATPIKWDFSTGNCYTFLKNAMGQVSNSVGFRFATYNCKTKYYDSLSNVLSTTNDLRGASLLPGGICSGCTQKSLAIELVIVNNKNIGYSAGYISVKLSPSANVFTELPGYTSIKVSTVTFTPTTMVVTTNLPPTSVPTTNPSQTSSPSSTPSSSYGMQKLIWKNICMMLIMTIIVFIIHK